MILCGEALIYILIYNYIYCTYIHILHDILRDGAMMFLDLGASEYWSKKARWKRIRKVSWATFAYPTCPRWGHLAGPGCPGFTCRMFTRFTCSMHFYAVPCKLAEFYCTMSHHATALSRSVLAKAGATGAETQVLRGMDFFVWCLGGTECFGRMALIEETGSKLQTVPLLHCVWSLLLVNDLRWGINLQPAQGWEVPHKQVATGRFQPSTGCPWYTEKRSAERYWPNPNTYDPDRFKRKCLGWFKS